MVSIDQGISPKVERWPLKAPQKSPPAVRQTGVHGMKSTKSTTDAVRRVSPMQPKPQHKRKQGNSRRLWKSCRRGWSRGRGTPCRIKEGLEGSFGAQCADSAVRIFHHELRTAVGRDRCATSCRARVIDRSQGQRLRSEAAQCRPSRSRIIGGVTHGEFVAVGAGCWRKSCK